MDAPRAATLLGDETEPHGGSQTVDASKAHQDGSLRAIRITADVSLKTLKQLEPTLTPWTGS